MEGMIQLLIAFLILAVTVSYSLWATSIALIAAVLVAGTGVVGVKACVDKDEVKTRVYIALLVVQLCALATLFGYSIY